MPKKYRSDAFAAIHSRCLRATSRRAIKDTHVRIIGVRVQLNGKSASSLFGAGPSSYQKSSVFAINPT